MAEARKEVRKERVPDKAPKNVLKVGLTGGIAAGKSVVGEMFAALGAHVIQADEISHQLMQPGQAVYREVVAHFGREILNPDGSVNRSRLAELAFSSQPSRVQELNQIVHPAVIRRQERWMEQVGQRDPGAVAIVEAALILEAGMATGLDRLVVVTCRPEQRIERWARRLNVDQETARREVTRRMAAQLPDEEKVKAADYVVDNSGSLDETRRQVKDIYTELLVWSGRSRPL
jgi:dephospho-CoA kinase